MVLPRLCHRTDVNFTYVKSVACLATVLSGVGVRSTSQTTWCCCDLSRASGFALALAWSSSVGDLAVELTAVRLLLGLQSRVDVVGVIVGVGRVLSGGVELRSGAACLQAERQERLRCCPPTSLRLGL